VGCEVGLDEDGVEVFGEAPVGVELLGTALLGLELEGDAEKKCDGVEVGWPVGDKEVGCPEGV